MPASARAGATGTAAVRPRRGGACRTLPPRPWAEVFEGAPYSDWGADGASADAYARGNVLLQCTGSHAERLRAYLAEVLGLETLAVLLPVGGGAKSGKGVRVLLVHAPVDERVDRVADQPGRLPDRFWIVRLDP